MAGSLFNRAWEACRGGEERGNQISLMLSTAFRVLHASRVIALVDRRDAPTTWNLFPAQSHITRVTHIGRGEAF